jgi:hypothetical protein
MDSLKDLTVRYIATIKTTKGTKMSNYHENNPLGAQIEELAQTDFTRRMIAEMPHYQEQNLDDVFHQRPTIYSTAEGCLKPIAIEKPSELIYPISDPLMFTPIIETGFKVAGWDVERFEKLNHVGFKASWAGNDVFVSRDTITNNDYTLEHCAVIVTGDELAGRPHLSLLQVVTYPIACDVHFALDPEKARTYSPASKFGYGITVDLAKDGKISSELAQVLIEHFKRGY